MKRLLGSLLVLSAVFLLAESPASAHFKLNAPTDSLKTDDEGTPTAGSQKTSPCGSGTSSKLATQVKAGGKLHIKLTETVAHGGHYRVALSPNKGDFIDPKAVVTGGNCVSAPKAQTGDVILADGLFEHNQDDFDSGKVWETDVTMPEKTCPNCLLQVIEFMTPHSPSCYYYHCANIQVVDANATIEGDGVVPFVAGETPGTSSGTSGETSSGGTSGETSSSGSTSGNQTLTQPQTKEGCNTTTGSSSPSLITLGLAGLFVVGSSLRRRRRLDDRGSRLIGHDK